MSTVTIGLLNKKRGNFKIQEKFAGADEVVELSRLPSRPEMLGLVVSTAQSAGARLISAISAPGARLAGAVKAGAEESEG